MHNVISGCGQFHTNEADPKKPKRKLRPYEKFDLTGIRCLVDRPPTRKKTTARWIIPSSLASRSFDEQSRNGSYLYLWADLDQQPKPLKLVKDVLESIIGICDYEIYTTSSATELNPKARILVPLANALAPKEWQKCQHHLNTLLEQHSILPDRTSERFAQLCYLPNKGDYYQTIYQRNDIYFDPLIVWRCQLLADLSTERTDDYRGLLKITEITEVIDGVGGWDYSDLPEICVPTCIGQRNTCLFQFARLLKSKYPNAEASEMRAEVMAWHKLFIDVIGTINFLETWTDFSRGWKKVRFPYGQTIESIVDRIPKEAKIPNNLTEMGYDNRSFRLLLICRELQMRSSDDPFFISARTAGDFVNCHFTAASKILAAMVSDGILELVRKGEGSKASRYRYIWPHSLD